MNSNEVQHKTILVKKNHLVKQMTTYNGDDDGRKVVTIAQMVLWIR
jgi:hypothetical protein